MAVRVTVQATDAFKHYKIRCRQLVYYWKGSCKSHTFQDLSLWCWGGRCVAFREVRRNYTTLQPWPFELRCKPPTLSSTASFGSGSWYTTEKDPARAIPFKTFRCDVEAVVVLLFVRSEAKLPSTMVRVTVQATDAFKYCKLRFR
jgi:hypothetical protein